MWQATHVTDNQPGGVRLTMGADLDPSVPTTASLSLLPRSVAANRSENSSAMGLHRYATDHNQPGRHTAHVGGAAHTAHAGRAAGWQAHV